MMLTELRTATQLLHAALESHLNILDPDFSREDYFHLLERFYGFYAPLEAVIPAYGNDPAEWLDGDRRKGLLLASDLSSTGMSVEAQEQLPRCSDLPQVFEGLRQLGCMYVLEGATLGGQVVLREVQPRLGLNPDETSFFASYGRQVGTMWRAFCQRLERLENSPDACRVVIDSACSTFESMRCWLAGKRSQ